MDATPTEPDAEDPRNVAVYTVITGTYDDPPTVVTDDEDVRWYCFSDHLTVAPSPWTLVPIEGYFKDPKLTSGYLKTNPHLLFPPSTIVVWVDANLDRLQIRADDMRELVSHTPFAMPAHRDRTDTASESRVVVERGLDDETRVSRLVRELDEAGYPDDQGLGATMLVVRDLSEPAVHTVNKVWWDGIARLSRRDQLTVNYALWKVGLEWHEVAVDYREPNSLFTRLAHSNPEGRVLRDNPGGSKPAQDAAWMNLGHVDLPPDYPTPVIWPAESWDHTTAQLLRDLNAVVAQSVETLEGNYCHFHQANVQQRTPPDIRRSWKREFLRRASSTSRRALEVGFNAGHSAAILLGANPSLNLLSIDIGEHSYSLPSAQVISNTYPDRFEALWGDSAEVLPTLPNELVESIDFVHIDGGHGEGAFHADFEWFLTHTGSGCLLLVDDVYVDRIRQPIEDACATGTITEVLPGFESSGENRLYRKA